MRILSLFLFSVLSSIAVSAQVSTTVDRSRPDCCGSGTKDDRESYRKPKIRTITAFVRIEPSQYRQQIEEAVTVLRRAKAAFEKGGYEVQTIRITTQPFTQYVGGRSAAEALDFFKSLDDLSKRGSFMLNIGPLTLADSSDAAKVELLSQVLAQTRANASLVVADEDGVRWSAIRSAAQVIKYVEDHSPNGTNNFDFAAVAMVPPNVPFFPLPITTVLGMSFRLAGKQARSLPMFWLRLIET